MVPWTSPVMTAQGIEYELLVYRGRHSDVYKQHDPRPLTKEVVHSNTGAAEEEDEEEEEDEDDENLEVSIDAVVRCYSTCSALTRMA